MSEDRTTRNQIFGGQDISSGIERRSIMEDDFGWDVPVETVPIPSEGKVYHQNSSLFNRSTVDIKAMTAYEEDILTSRALITRGVVINKLLESCVIEEGIDVSEMLIGDRNALMVAVRVTGYGVEYNASTRCPVCAAAGSYTFNLGELSIKRLDINPVTPGENRFEFILPVTKKTVHFKFLTGRDESEMSQEGDRLKKMFPDKEVENNVTRKLKRSILSVDGIQDRSKVDKFVMNMPALDSRRLRGYIDTYEPGIDMSSSMTCRACGATSEVSLPMAASFFWPRD